jgi:hypothetical protein
VQNGVAALKGPVRTQEEKAAIEAKAAAVVGQDHVVDQMEISLDLRSAIQSYRLEIAALGRLFYLT